MLSGVQCKCNKSGFKVNKDNKQFAQWKLQWKQTYTKFIKEMYKINFWLILACKNISVYNCVVLLRRKIQMNIYYNGDWALSWLCETEFVHDRHLGESTDTSAHVWMLYE